RVEDVLPRAETGACEHRDDHPLLVLPRLVAEADRRRLAVALELGLDDRRIEVEGVRRHRPPIIRRCPTPKQPWPFGPCPSRRRTSGAAGPRRAGASAPRRPRAGTPVEDRRAGPPRSGRGRTRRP